ncbi:hypothetical protein DPMN_188066 [Dreissena polymorpha]|uniref:Uncharacterized protein n=1 Tax=Dreissena polymorpha TaxID=45954 RepID=A0A9D4I9L3_DREPO|nr:hypothetical protein DPMN_188066 [Dreissena polymorpha]
MQSAQALPRYGSGHKSARRTDGQPDGRTTPKQYPFASGGDKNRGFFNCDFSTLNPLMHAN